MVSESDDDETIFEKLVEIVSVSGNICIVRHTMMNNVCASKSLRYCCNDFLKVHNNGLTQVTVMNASDFKLHSGDKVNLAISCKVLLKGLFYMYLFPTLMWVTVAFLSSIMNFQEGYIVLLSFSFFLLILFLLRYYNYWFFPSQKI